MGGDLSIGNLKATITLADQFSGPLDKIGKAVGLSSKSITAIGQASGLAVASIVTTTAAIAALGQRGAEVSDVQDAFAGLSGRVGETSDAMLGGLQRATLGTISNFDLMKLANTALGSGLVKSSKDMETLAGGAKLLADRTGGDTAQAFETLTDAIAKGRTATLKQYGVFVDSKTAIEQYAQKLGVATGDLTDSQRATALSEAALKALRKELKEAGPTSADFGDRIAQGKVAIQNFTDSLGVAIATSPAVAAGMSGIATALQQAFGGTQQETVKTLTGYVNRFAIFLLDAASVGVTAAHFITDAFTGTKFIFNAVLEALFSGIGKAADTLADLAEKAKALPIVGSAFTTLAGDLHATGDMANSLAVGFGAMKDKAVESSNASTIAFAAVETTLANTRAEMVKASEVQVQIATTAPAAAAGVKSVGDAFVPTAAQVKAYEDALLAAITAQDNMTANGVAQMASLQDQIAVLMSEGLARQLLEIQIAQDAELAQLQTKYDVTSAMYQQLADKIREKYGLIASAAIESSNQETAAHMASTTSGIAAAEQALETARNSRAAILANVKSTNAAILAADAQVAAAEKKLAEEKTAHRIQQFNLIADAAKTFISAVFGKGKIAAIATAIIDTAQAVVKALASAPPPLNYALAGAVGAAGLIQINKIRSTEAGFASGTPGTMFVDFGRETSVPLHGPEAVVTPKQGASVAGMVEDALKAQDARTVEELRGLRADLAADRQTLPLLMKGMLELAKA